MEKEHDILEQQEIKKGFNQGYLLAQHRPEFIEAIKTSKEGEKIPYFKAVLSGAKQYDKDKSKEMQKTQIKAVDKTKDPQKQKTPTKPTPKPPTRGR